MIETLYRIRCDTCGKTTGAHTENNHIWTMENLKNQGWMIRFNGFQDDVPMVSYCPDCVREETE